MCFRPNQARSKERNALLKDIERAGGPLAGLLDRGKYFGWMQACAYLLGSLRPESGEIPRDSPFFEIYANGPQHITSSDLVTLIHVPLE